MLKRSAKLKLKLDVKALMVLTTLQSYWDDRPLSAASAFETAKIVEFPRYNRRVSPKVIVLPGCGTSELNLPELPFHVLGLIPEPRRDPQFAPRIPGCK